MIFSHLWSLEANLPRGTLVAGVALKDNRGTGQAGATSDLEEEACPRDALVPKAPLLTHYLQAREAMVSLLSFDPRWALEGKQRQDSRVREEQGQG